MYSYRIFLGGFVVSPFSYRIVSYPYPCFVISCVSALDREAKGVIGSVLNPRLNPHWSYERQRPLKRYKTSAMLAFVTPSHHSIRDSGATGLSLYSTAYAGVVPSTAVLAYASGLST